MEGGVSFSGRVVSRDEKTISVALASENDAQSIFTPDKIAVIAFQDNDALLSAQTRVRGLESGCLVLEFGPKIRRIRRRRYHRFPCSQSVAIRALRDDGCVGAWLHGVMENISAGGARLILSAQGLASERWEARFCLPADSPAATEPGAEPRARSRQDREPIRTIGRIAQTRRMPDGYLQVGLEFIAISDRDRQRLIERTKHSLGETEDES